MTQVLNSSEIRLVYEPWGKNQSFKSVDNFLAYCRKLDTQNAQALMQQGICQTWNDAKSLVAEWNKQPFWREGKFRFWESANCNLIEVSGKQVLIGCPSHYFTYTFKTHLEALREGEKAARLAIQLNISLDSFSREDVDRLVQEFDLI